MTGLVYEVISGGLTSARVDQERARELYERAASDPRPDLVALTGDLIVGFAFWVVDEKGVRLVRKQVEPVGPAA